MKKKLILPILSILALASCKVNSDASISGDKTNLPSLAPSTFVDSDLVTLKEVAVKYDSEESLSFNNYLSNALNLPIYNDQTIIYNNKVFKIEGNDISFKGNYTPRIYQNEENSLADLISKDYNLSDIVYVKDCQTAYEITDNNLGLDFRMSNNLYARPIVNKGVINGSALGLKGDSNYDNAEIFINIFGSLEAYHINSLVLDGQSYQCNHRFSLWQAQNFNIIGNNSTLVVNNDYDDTKSAEFFFDIVDSSSILFSKLNFRYDFTRNVDQIKTQVGVHNSSNIEFADSSYILPDGLKELRDTNHEFTNLDLYQHWENVIIRGCTFTNLCDGEAGGCLWIRDFRNLGCKSCKVLNSSFYKVAHDEILAVFSSGPIDNVIIKGNSFTIPDDGASSSVMNFTLGTGSHHTNILFENNKVDACSTGGIFWCHGKNVVIKNNEIKAHLSKKAPGGNYRVVEAQSAANGDLNYVEEFSSNQLEVDSYNEDYSAQVHILHNVKKANNNTITVGIRSTDIFLNVDEILNNKITANSYINYVFYNVSDSVSGNEINLNALIGTVFRYYGISLAQNVLIERNSFKYTYEEQEGDSSCLIMLNGSRMNGFRIDFMNNTIYAKALAKKSRCLFYAPDDDNKQSSKFIDNQLDGVNINKNYLKNCEIQFE